MKTKDIIVGQKYSHQDLPNVVYLGVAMEAYGHSPLRRKHLVIISPAWYAGLVVHPPRNKDLLRFWKGFVRISDNL